MRKRCCRGGSWFHLNVSANEVVEGVIVGGSVGGDGGVVGGGSVGSDGGDEEHGGLFMNQRDIEANTVANPHRRKVVWRVAPSISKWCIPILPRATKERGAPKERRLFRIRTRCSRSIEDD